MTNYDRHKLILADILIQNYKTDGKEFYEICNLELEEDVSDIQDITLDWLLPKWNDKEWKSKIIFSLIPIMAIDKRENDTALGLCSCESITCIDCAFGDVFTFGCSRTIRRWLEEEE